MSESSESDLLHDLKVCISGSIPTREERQEIGGNDNDIISTVSALASLIFKSGGVVVHGSHPTFTPIIEKAAKDVFDSPKPGRTRMHYAPRFFDESHAAMTWNEFRTTHEGLATLILAGEFGTDRDAALDLLRQAMIADCDVLVTIGGRSHSANPQIRPGIDHEIELARNARKPVIPIGWSGGRTRRFLESIGGGENGIRDIADTKLRSIVGGNSLDDSENLTLMRGPSPDGDTPYSVTQAVEIVRKGLLGLAKK